MMVVIYSDRIKIVGSGNYEMVMGALNRFY